MVKNTQGGARTKGMARKHMNGGGGGRKLRIPVEEGEEFGCVTKLYGNGMCEIYTNDNEKLTGIIRGSMRGRQKRHNKVTASTVVLVGLRTWESTKKNCDILCLYEDDEVEQLKNMPSVKIDKILDIRNNNMGITKEHAEIVDFEEAEEENFICNEKELNTEDFSWENKEEIVLDDI
jgi:initiation factor 1A|uniref:S1-like domain-containing protein n=1 Tax=viral metagenome TaxID=1070528 RepID=A0A6C0IMP2_9ZZZZ